MEGTFILSYVVIKIFMAIWVSLLEFDLSKEYSIRQKPKQAKALEIYLSWNKKTQWINLWKLRMN